MEIKETTRKKVAEVQKLMNENQWSEKRACKHVGLNRNYFRNLVARISNDRFEQCLLEVEKEKEDKNKQISMFDLPFMDCPQIVFEDKGEREYMEDGKMENIEKNEALNEEQLVHEMNICKALRNFRYFKKMTQQSFGGRCGLNRTTYAHVESGREAFEGYKKEMILARFNLTEEELLKYANMNVKYNKNVVSDGEMKKLILDRWNGNNKHRKHEEETNVVEEETTPVLDEIIIDTSKNAIHELVDNDEVLQLRKENERLSEENERFKTLHSGKDKQIAELKNELESTQNKLTMALNRVSELQSKEVPMVTISEVNVPEELSNAKKFIMEQTKIIAKLSAQVARYEAILDRLVA